ncbi:MAG TPA: hypothetical protein PLU67_06695 [Candidatus Kapabacteria bacterium]|nr:hypothetical protein [Candidatus Kapabacteria bacterium]
MKLLGAIYENNKWTYDVLNDVGTGLQIENGTLKTKLKPAGGLGVDEEGLFANLSAVTQNVDYVFYVADNIANSAPNYFNNWTDLTNYLLQIPTTVNIVVFCTTSGDISITRSGSYFFFGDVNLTITATNVVVNALQIVDLVVTGAQNVKINAIKISNFVIGSNSSEQCEVSATEINGNIANISDLRIYAKKITNLNLTFAGGTNYLFVKDGGTLIVRDSTGDIRANVYGGRIDSLDIDFSGTENVINVFDTVANFVNILNGNVNFYNSKLAICSINTEDFVKSGLNNSFIGDLEIMRSESDNSVLVKLNGCNANKVTNTSDFEQDLILANTLLRTDTGYSIDGAFRLYVRGSSTAVTNYNTNTVNLVSLQNLNIDNSFLVEQI